MVMFSTGGQGDDILDGEAGEDVCGGGAGRSCTDRAVLDDLLGGEIMISVFGGSGSHA